MRKWVDVIEMMGDTPDTRAGILNAYLKQCEHDYAAFFDDDALSFLSYINKSDDQLWLSHIVPIISVWPKDERERFKRLLGHYDASASEGDAEFDVFSAEQLRHENVPDTRWIVEGILPEGLANLAGRPKQGKSWLALNIAISVAMGGKALGMYSIPTSGSVLYLALEDNKTRLKSRMNHLMRQFTPWPDNLWFSIYSPRMGEGFIERLRRWLDTHHDPSLVVVDMYTKISQRRKSKSSGSDYDEIYEELDPLYQLSYEYRICSLLVMHLNKNEDAKDASSRIMGSTAYAGASVTNLTLRRLSSGNAADAVLSPEGKDLEDESDIALIFDKGIWTSRGEADVYHQSQQRLEILQALYMAKGKETTPKDIAADLGKNPNTTRRLLQKLREDGLITRDSVGDTYHLTNAGAEVIKARTSDDGRERNLDRFENEPDLDDESAPPWLEQVDPNF